MCINMCKQSRSLAQMKSPGRWVWHLQVGFWVPSCEGENGSRPERVSLSKWTYSDNRWQLSQHQCLRVLSSLPAPPHPSRGLCGASAPLLPRVGQTEPPTSHPQRQKPSCMFSAPPFPQEAGGELLFSRLSQHRIQARSCD